MKNVLIGLALIAASSSAQAFDFFNNGGEWKMGPQGPYYEESTWPEWTPMYWMEEFFDSWDDDNGYDAGYGMMPPPYGMPNMGGFPQMPYGNAQMMPPMNAQMPYPMPPVAMPAAPNVAVPAPVAPQAAPAQ